MRDCEDSHHWKMQLLIACSDSHLPKGPDDVEAKVMRYICNWYDLQVWICCVTVVSLFICVFAAYGSKCMLA